MLWAGTCKGELRSIPCHNVCGALSPDSLGFVGLNRHLSRGKMKLASAPGAAAPGSRSAYARGGVTMMWAAQPAMALPGWHAEAVEVEAQQCLQQRRSLPEGEADDLLAVTWCLIVT